jgi:hypothetical protein
MNYTRPTDSQMREAAGQVSFVLFVLKNKYINTNTYMGISAKPLARYLLFVPSKCVGIQASV